MIEQNILLTQPPKVPENPTNPNTNSPAAIIIAIAILIGAIAKLIEASK